VVQRNTIVIATLLCIAAAAIGGPMVLHRPVAPAAAPPSGEGLPFVPPQERGAPVGANTGAPADYNPGTFAVAPSGVFFSSAASHWSSISRAGKARATSISASS
jgi:hypothetical protein